MNKFLIALGIIIVIVLAGFGWYKGGYDRAVAKDEMVKSAWSQVENEIQRRNDLIPNLVNTVKGYATQEKTVFTDVTRLRSQWGEAKTIPEKIDNANAMSGALSRLLMVTENYPQLKSNENFLALQTQLEGTENRIAVERMRYNQAAQDLNTFRRELFGQFFASKAGIKEAAVYFKAEEKAKSVPTVNF
ncbi:MAG: LemA family protein [Candidatus Omnitrophica bacterium]|nr:LemA family protein [Candidatus Omnitrophota bacterium]